MRTSSTPGAIARRLALPAACLLLTCAPPAAAQGIDETLIEGSAEQSCRALAAGSGGMTDQARADPTSGLPPTWAQAQPGLLPARVDLRSSTETFNRLYEFALRGGDLYARVRGDNGAWRRVPLPACIAGRLTGISVDDDELVALDPGGRIYTMDNALKDAALWNWTSRWGTPVWTGPGYALPGGVEAWSWSVISLPEDGSWLDPAGNRTKIGDFKVSHIWGLRTGGQRLTFWDPWLPLDESYEACGPGRGRFRSVNLSASGSHLFVIGAHGDMFTRLYDFDISGHNAVFFRYSYENQRGKGDGAPIQLPAEPWARQPKIPGAITSAISIHKVGKGSVHRILRVEGERGGATGYWERDIAAPVSAGWRFQATGRALVGRRLDNPARNMSAVGLGPSEDARYVMRKDGIEAELVDFNVYCSPARLRIRENGREREVLLHQVDGLRQRVRGRGLDDTPRAQFGAIEGPKGTFESATVQATRTEVVLEERGWRFRREDLPAAGPRCLPRRMKVGSRGVGPVRLGMTRAALRRRTPTPTRRASSSWRWCVAGGGRVAVTFTSGRVSLVATTASRHALGAVRPGVGLRAVRRALPGRRPLGRSLLRAGARSQIVVGFHGPRVRFLAVAPRPAVDRPARLLRLLRRAGVIAGARR